MPDADTIRRKITDAEAELADLRADLGTVEAHEADAATALRAAIRDGAGEKKRATLASKHATARGLLDAQHGSIRDAEAEVAALRRDLTDQEHTDRIEAARQRLDTAEARMSDLGKNFLDTIEEPLRDLASAWHELRSAAKAAREHGITNRAPHLPRYLRARATHTPKDEWWRAAIGHINALTTAMEREEAAKEREARRPQIEAARERQRREGQKRMLARLRAREHSGERERRERLEAEVGAELDADLDAGRATLPSSIAGRMPTPQGGSPESR